ncbi:MAG: N-acetylornithine carbamoyltransferase [Cyclobacteriaceae bacterium]
MKKFISVKDVSSVESLVQIAAGFKAAPLKYQQAGQGKILGLLFMNPSLRTRISTQVAAKNLGMEVIVFNADKDGWQLEFGDGAVMNGSTTEHVKEAASVLGEYVDVLGVRSFPGLADKEKDYSEYIIESFIRHSGVPVISLESATLHPLQSLADILTMTELKPEGRKPKVVMTWAPHVKALPQAVPNSFAEWINAWGQADFVITHPEGYELDKKFTGQATITHHQDDALKDADFIYVKNWSSYTDYGKILNTDPGWMVTAEKIKVSRKAKIMHCLPVRRNLVIADEVLDGPDSEVIRQAGNRVWAAQAVLYQILKNI